MNPCATTHWISSGLSGRISKQATRWRPRLFVHPNTVRYRLKKIIEVVEWDPGVPRDALTIHLALILGSMSEPNQSPQPSGPTKL